MFPVSTRPGGMSTERVGHPEHDVRYGAVLSRRPVPLKGQNQARQLRGQIGRPGPPTTIEKRPGRAGRSQGQPRCG